MTDIKGSIEAAQSTSVEGAVAEPARRLDSLVADPASGGQLLRSDYAGEVWFGGRPKFEKDGIVLPGRYEQITSAIVLPDSHVYRAETIGEALIQTTGALLSARTTSQGGDAQILGCRAALTPDPGDASLLRVELTVEALALLSVGVSYRVTVICSPDAVAPSSP